MTVAELIENLKRFEDQNLEVKFQYNYGDHWRTQVAANVTVTEEGYIKYSDYHSMYVVDDKDEDPKSILAVLLS